MQSSKVFGYDINGKIVCEFRDYIELIWNERIQEFGHFTLFILRKDYKKEVQFIVKADSKHFGIIQSEEFNVEENGNFVTLSGLFFESIFALNEYVLKGETFSFDKIKGLEPFKFQPEPNQFEFVVNELIGERGLEEDFDLFINRVLKRKYRIDFKFDNQKRINYVAEPFSDFKDKIFIGYRFGNTKKIYVKKDWSAELNGVKIDGEHSSAGQVITWSSSPCGWQKIGSLTLGTEDDLDQSINNFKKEHSAVEIIEVEIIEEAIPEKLKLGDIVSIDLEEFGMYSAKIIEVSEIHKGNMCEREIKLGDLERKGTE